MAQNTGGDKITRNIVIGMVTLVVAVGVIFSVLGNRASTSVSLPSQTNTANGSGIEFNSELTGVPVVDIWEDFQCPSCKVFESTNGSALKALAVEKKAKVVFHPLSFLGPESVFAANGAACAAEPNAINVVAAIAATSFSTRISLVNYARFIIHINYPPFAAAPF
jgi:protein-disulfide isomerase